MFLSVYLILIQQYKQMSKGKNSISQQAKRMLAATKKQEMRIILDSLAQNKKNNKNNTIQLKHVTQFAKTKKIRKHKKQKEQEEVLEDEKDMIEEDKIANEARNLKVNIFAMEQYHNDIPKTVQKHRKLNQNQSSNEEIKQKVYIQFLPQKFGDKPLKPIKVTDQNLKIDEQIQEESINKNLKDWQIKMPQGVYKLQRTKKIQQSRTKLPIYMNEQQIVECISQNLVTLICGQTGSGKTTQIPQFLVEKNYHLYGKIGVTQPRRLAASSVSRRVAEEMNLTLGQQVGFQIRHFNQSSKNTIIKFMTDGILFRQMSSDPLLRDYGVIIIDEAHQRKIDTDILIGLLSRVILIRHQMYLQKLCSPLRLVLMSATMRVEDFKNTNLFNFQVPIIKVQSRMFDVKNFHEKVTPEDYIQAAVKKCVKIHFKLPEGDVLIFLTGKQEIKSMMIMLKSALQRQNFEMEEDNFQEQQGQEDLINQNIQNKISPPSNFIIYPLYSSLPNQDQQKIFQPTNPNCRKFVIATSIAQTSITIPNIKYVVDSGYQKHKYFQGVWKWRKQWESKATANQRTGRAGRTTNGYCYRLYSTAVYSNLMSQYPLPQIMRLPLYNTILQIKSIGISNIYKFPFPTPPEQKKLYEYTSQLKQIGVLQNQVDEKADNTSITELGKVLSFIPIDPKLGKMLLVGIKLNIEQYITYCALLTTVQSIFSEDMNFNRFQSQGLMQISEKNKLEKQKRQAKQIFYKRYQKFMKNSQKCDLILTINIIGYFLMQVLKHRAPISIKSIDQQSKNLHLNINTMRQIYHNIDQLCQIFQTLTGRKIDLLNYKIPQSNQVKQILDVLLCSFVGNLCILQEKNRYKNKMNEDVYIHRLSSLHHKNQLFVCCCSFQASLSGKKYMKYPFVVQNYQLLGSFGKVDPVKECLWRDNKVMGLTKGTIYGWDIPVIVTDKIDSEIKYFQLARFFLSGIICPSIKSINNYLKFSPTIIKQDCLKQEVQRIVQIFKESKAVTKQDIVQCFRKSPNFMKKELKLWLTVSNYEEIYIMIRKSVLQF